MALLATTATAPAADSVKVLMIGYPDKDSTDPVTGAPVPGIGQLKAAFEKANPDIKVKVTQTSWGDYWTTLSTGFVSGTAPDVFVNHLSRYPEFVANELLVDIAPMIKKDNVPTDNSKPLVTETGTPVTAP